ncbi:MAG TPA: NAD(P)/FAD-dependent oxidoreductase [Rhodopila sp.]
MPIERIDTVVIGGGQAGLTMSHCLTRSGVPHVVLERRRIAERWRSERWESLRFQFPNWALRLPDFGYAGDEPDGFASRDEVVRFIETYADFIQAPARTGVEVRRLRHAPDGAGFWLDTGDATIAAENVVIATGPYQRPAIPAGAGDLGDVVQIAANGYRNPAQLPPGGVLVVGAGASGCQIAEELLRAGRPVVLSVGRHRRVPRRYRGRDIIWWINALGLDEKVADVSTARQPPLLISGANGGRTIDLRGFAAAGMVLAGGFEGARDGIVSFAPDLAAHLAAGDEAYAAFLHAADAHAVRAGLKLPDESGPADVFPVPASVADPIERLDLAAAGITTVIWATGYRDDFGWVDLDIFAPTADSTLRIPVHRRGVTPVAGVYFLGLPLLHKTKSSFLSGVGEDAAYLAEQITAREPRRP